MVVKDLTDARPFVAGDGSLLREILHPDHDPVDLGFSLAHATVEPGRKTVPHRLACAEVYYVSAGEGIMHVGPESARVRPGQAVHIPAGAVQWIESVGPGDLVFLCIVAPPWTPDCEEALRERVR